MTEKKKREFKIPKAPTRRGGDAYAAFTKQKYAELNAGETPELEEMPFTERAKLLGAEWNSMAEEEKKSFEDAAIEALREKLREWDGDAEAREEQRRKHCRKLGLGSSASWEKVKRTYDHGTTTTAAAEGSGGGGSSGELEASAARQKRQQQQQQQQQQKTPAAAAVVRGSVQQQQQQQHGKRRRVSGDTLEDPMWSDGTAWEPVLRKKAILKGLDQIFKLAQHEENFTLFGNDIIQCFYDVATVSGEPVRTRCLKYVEQLAHRWKHGAMSAGGWKLAEVPRPDEIVQASIGMYCMERVGIHHDLKQEVRSFLEIQSTHYSASDFIGWDPKQSTIGVRGHVDENGNSISVFRSLSNALIYTFYADRVGLTLAEGCSYADVFKHLPVFRPWSGPQDLPKQLYVDQCYLVTHVVFTLNNWGELMLDPGLMPHEFHFARTHLAHQISCRDVHLVGEFVEVLRCFGCTDEDPLIRSGLAFLLSEQDEATGLWDGDKDPYTVYHATMVGVQALLAHRYRGYGPGITQVAPLLCKWAKDEVEAAAAAAAPSSMKDAGGNGDASAAGSKVVGAYSRKGKAWWKQQMASTNEVVKETVGGGDEAIGGGGESSSSSSSVSSPMKDDDDDDDCGNATKEDGQGVNAEVVEKVDTSSGEAPVSTKEEQAGDGDGGGGGGGSGSAKNDDPNDGGEMEPAAAVEGSAGDSGVAVSESATEAAPPLPPAVVDDRVSLLAAATVALLAGKYSGAPLRNPTNNTMVVAAAATGAHQEAGKAGAPTLTLSAGGTAQGTFSPPSPSSPSSSSANTGESSAPPFSTSSSSSEYASMTTTTAAAQAPPPPPQQQATGGAVTADQSVGREVKRAERVLEELETAASQGDWPLVSNLLSSKCEDLSVSTRLLRECGIGKAVRKLGKRVAAASSASGEVKGAVVNKADKLVAKWKAIVSGK